MPAHLRQRKDRGGTWYLVDGRKKISLKTSIKRYALARLEQYHRGKFGLTPNLTIASYFATWIERKCEPVVRRSLERAYRQHFKCYIEPRFGGKTFPEVRAAALVDFMQALMKQGLKTKTVRNIIGGTFRAIWRDAMVDELVETMPFDALQWPELERHAPDPFAPEERDAILSYIADKQPFYYPFVRFQFETGCRPSEAVALRWADLWAEVDPNGATISITKSRNMGAEAKPKTQGSWRTIMVSDELVDLLLAMKLPWHDDHSHVFYNKFSGGPLDANQWTRVYWKDICEGAKVPHRKFYATRHTSITEAVKRGENLLAIAQYHGTSLEMIQRNYCGKLKIGRPVLDPRPPKSAILDVVPAGIEPHSSAAEIVRKAVTSRFIDRLSKRKIG